jgi:hypothetical protein
MYDRGRVLKLPQSAFFGNFRCYASPVTLIDQKTQLFENIVRLRRAMQAAPESQEIAAVRQSLEEQLGETVSQRLAARLLGVSHTALARWIDRGDVPLVYRPDGRTEVPVAALLGLYDAVESERTSGTRKRHVIEPSIVKQHALALGLDPKELVADVPPGPGHRRAERRSLAYHRALARRLRRPMVEEARQTLWKWRAQGKIDERYAKQWEGLLRQPIPEIRKAITEDTRTARDLRQNSPFAGVLSEPERRRILEEVT